MADRNFHVACACLQGKKDACQIFNNILRRQIGTRSPTVEYFCSHQEVLFILLKGCVSHTHTHTHTQNTQFNCGCQEKVTQMSFFKGTRRPK